MWRADQINWDIKADLWRDVIVRSDGAIMASKDAYERASNLISYLIAADHMEEDEKQRVCVEYNTARGYDFEHPPKDREPEMLPPPVVAEEEEAEETDRGVIRRG